MMDDRYTFLYTPTATTPSVADLDALIAQFEWLAPLRVVRERLTHQQDPRLAVMRPWRVESALRRLPIDRAALVVQAPDEVIDRFLRETDLRIVADQDEAAVDVRIEAELDDEDQIVSEQLADIYLAQGLRDQALAIYRKLSLLNPEKSIYFAELITKIENNN